MNIQNIPKDKLNELVKRLEKKELRVLWNPGYRTQHERRIVSLYERAVLEWYRRYRMENTWFDKVYETQTYEQRT